MNWWKKNSGDVNWGEMNWGGMNSAEKTSPLSFPLCCIFPIIFLTFPALFPQPAPRYRNGNICPPPNFIACFVKLWLFFPLLDQASRLASQTAEVKQEKTQQNSISPLLETNDGHPPSVARPFERALPGNIGLTHSSNTGTAYGVPTYYRANKLLE